MRDHFFLHYGWFFQNLRKEAVRTFMHTTVTLVLIVTVLELTLVFFLAAFHSSTIEKSQCHKIWL